jgi:hypothetical protein
MATSKELPEILVCPVCNATVELKPGQGGLKCTAVSTWRGPLPVAVPHVL